MKVSKFTVVMFSVLLILTISGCRSAETATPQSTPTTLSNATYQTLTIDAFADILANESASYTVVNVHIPYEGEVENTDLDIAYNDVEALTAALPNTSAPIILYCRSGRMSAEAAQVLAELGYSQVWDVPGGMNAWTASGRELLVRSTAEPQDS